MRFFTALYKCRKHFLSFLKIHTWIIKSLTLKLRKYRNLCRNEKNSHINIQNPRTYDLACIRNKYRLRFRPSYFWYVSIRIKMRYRICWLWRWKCDLTLAGLCRIKFFIWHDIRILGSEIAWFIIMTQLNAYCLVALITHPTLSCNSI